MEARGIYQRALEMDPAYAAARAGLALTYIADVARRSNGRATAHELELVLAKRARLCASIPISRSAIR